MLENTAHRPPLTAHRPRLTAHCPLPTDRCSPLTLGWILLGRQGLVLARNGGEQIPRQRFGGATITILARSQPSGLEARLSPRASELQSKI